MGIDGQDDDDDWWLNAEASPAPAASDPPAAAAPEADADASPDDLGPYPTFILDDGWEALDRAVTADDHYNAIAGLVFHARHLTPQEHARLAELLRTRFRRPRGRPQNHALAEAADRAANSLVRPRLPREVQVAELARTFFTSKENARKALRAAERRRAERRKQYGE
jgi:hypothetical protein